MVHTYLLLHKTEVRQRPQKLPGKTRSLPKYQAAALKNKSQRHQPRPQLLLRLLLLLRMVDLAVEGLALLRQIKLFTQRPTNRNFSRLLLGTIRVICNSQCLKCRPGRIPRYPRTKTTCIPPCIKYIPNTQASIMGTWEWCCHTLSPKFPR